MSGNLPALDALIDKFRMLPGIGKKSAERLVLELKDKLAKMSQISTAVPTAVQPIGMSANDAVNEAVEALVSLGYAERDVAPVVESLDDGKRDVSALIKSALVELGKGR